MSANGMDRHAPAPPAVSWPGGAQTRSTQCPQRQHRMRSSETKPELLAHHHTLAGLTKQASLFLRETTPGLSNMGGRMPQSRVCACACRGPCSPKQSRLSPACPAWGEDRNAADTPCGGAATVKRCAAIGNKKGRLGRALSMSAALAILSPSSRKITPCHRLPRTSCLTMLMKYFIHS